MRARNRSAGWPGTGSQPFPSIVESEESRVDRARPGSGAGSCGAQLTKRAKSGRSRGRSSIRPSASSFSARGIRTRNLHGTPDGSPTAGAVLRAHRGRPLLGAGSLEVQPHERFLRSVPDLGEPTNRLRHAGTRSAAPTCSPTRRPSEAEAGHPAPPPLRREVARWPPRTAPRPGTPGCEGLRSSSARSRRKTPRRPWRRARPFRREPVGPRGPFAPGSRLRGSPSWNSPRRAPSARRGEHRVASDIGSSCGFFRPRRACGREGRGRALGEIEGGVHRSRLDTRARRRGAAQRVDGPRFAWTRVRRARAASVRVRAYRARGGERYDGGRYADVLRPTARVDTSSPDAGGLCPRQGPPRA